ncbi:SDR family oxidoreductase [Burkholderia metallica]|uniref:SDR family oxidoreductase n=1 Tax=Burkholderia metallica TaxID=488729 RepID=UPI00157B4793|nr:SDR family oxidoreductase [Burkholderia metallica]NTZ81994.1 SDR family oxidoreductase [Burkholderia metallica]
MSSRTYLVTGASRGIGLAISTTLARRGHHVVGLARHAQGIDFPGELLACDLADIEQTAATLARIGERHDVDGIVNNAGIVLPQPLGKIDFQSLQTVFDLNVRAAIQVTQHFADAMKARGYGRIVNICSRAIFGSLDRTAYSAAKNALVGCTRTWALELAEHGVTVNAVAPGPIETELFRQTRPVGSEAERKVLATIPARRLGTADDVAAATAFFLSDEAGFVTGQVLSVDGGGSLGGRS